MLQRSKPPDSRIERQICTGLIVSEQFIREIKPILQPNSLQLPFTQIVANWCLEYFDQFQTAPGRNIQDIFIEHRKSSLDPDTAELIEDFLTGISDEYERQDVFNIGYILKKAEDHLRNVSLQNLSKEIAKAASGGRIEEGEALVKGYERIARPQARGVDPINDSSVIVNAFTEDSGDKLFSLPGAVGKMMGPMERGWLFSFVAPAKGGKTWWLMLTALKALFSGYNVIFVSMEMSEKAMTRRIHHYINGLPTRRWAGEMLIPVFDCEWNQKDTCKKSVRKNKIKLLSDEGNQISDFDDALKDYTPCTECMGTKKFACESWFKKVTKKELTIEQALRKKQAIKRSALVRGSRFHLVEFPSGTLTMSELKAYLYNREQYRGEIYDVICTDYADKMKAESSWEYRHGINEIWEGHKGLAQEKNALVATASQSNTARSGKDIKQGDWAEDIRKLNLIDAGMALNMSPEEKKRGVMRAGLMAQRHEFFDVLGIVHVLHQLKIGRPYLQSY